MDETSDTTGEGSARILRFLDDAHEVLFVRATMTDLFRAWESHVAIWERMPGEPGRTMMREALAAQVLHLSSRPRDEMTSWTFNLSNPPLNVFVTGDNGPSRITGRVISENVKCGERGRLFVESRRDSGERFQSVIEFEGTNVLAILESFYSRSEQCRARFFDLGHDEFVMAVSLPIEDSNWLAALDIDSVRAALAEGLRALDERLIWFQCGCDPKRILMTVIGFWRSDPDDLFAGEPRVEASCPRCGRRWWIRRDDFDRVAAES